jgi:hypothetical protein
MSKEESAAKELEVSTPSKGSPAEADPMNAPLQSLTNYLKANEKVHVAWCVSGIVGCLLLYGVLQVRECCQQRRIELPLYNPGLPARRSVEYFRQMCCIREVHCQVCAQEGACVASRE